MNESLELLFIYLRGIWKYRWTAMIVAWVVAIGGWIWVSTIPDRFEASTRVYIDTDSVLRPLLKGLTVETDVEQRLQLMTRTLLSRPNIEKLIRMTDMDITANTQRKMDNLVLKLSNNIEVQNEETGKKRRRGNTSNFYTISYQNSDRKLAKHVVESLLSILVESSLGDTRKDSSTARDFLNQQIKEYESKLSASEDRLAEFKRKNMDYLPSREGDYFSSLKAMQDKYDSAQLDLQEALKKRDTYKRELDRFRKSGVAVNAQGEPILSPTQERINKLQDQLDELLLKFTDNHPDVKELRRQIAALKQQEKAGDKNNDNNANVESDPMYQQLSLQLGKVESDISAAKVRVNEYAGRIKLLKGNIENLQNVEVELKQLDRNYALNKKNYDALVDRRDSANLAGQAAKTGEGIKFRVIDPPFVPHKAAAPNRTMLNSVVLLLAIASGLAIGFLLSQLNPAFYSRGILQEVTGVPMFGGVTRILNPREVLNRRKNYIVYSSVGTFLIFVFGTVILLQAHLSDVMSTLRQITGL